MRRSLSRIRSVILLLAIIMVSSLSIHAVYAEEVNDKIPITNEMLAREYAAHHSESLVAGNIVMWGIGAFLLASVGIVVFFFIKFKRSGGSHTGGKIALLVIFIPVIGILSITFALIAWGMNYNPDPEDASYSVEVKKVLRTEKESHVSGARHHTHTYRYYAYIEDDGRMSGEHSMMLSEEEYHRISAPGDYYVAIATSGSHSSEFALYSVDEYEPASDVLVN